MGEYDEFESSSISEQHRCIETSVVHCCGSHRQRNVELPMARMAEETFEMRRLALRERVQQQNSERVPTETVEVVSLGSV